MTTFFDFFENIIFNLNILFTIRNIEYESVQSNTYKTCVYEKELKSFLISPTL